MAQSTQFPEVPTTKLQWKTDRPVKMMVQLRHPRWCRTAKVKINGKPILESRHASSYIELKREWHSGDVVELEMLMELQAVPLTGNERIVAFVYGPIVLAGALGNEGIPPRADLTVNERLYGTLLNTPFTPPTLTGDPDTIVRQAKSAGSPLSFSIPANSTATRVELMPYYKIAHARYATYWKTAPEPDLTSTTQQQRPKCRHFGHLIHN